MTTPLFPEQLILLGCKECGTVVFDRAAHDQWHDFANRAVQFGTGNVQTNRFS